VSIEDLANGYKTWLEESITASSLRGVEAKAALGVAKELLDKMISVTGLKARTSDSMDSQRRTVTMSLDNYLLKRSQVAEGWSAGSLWLLELRSGMIGAAYAPPGFSEDSRSIEIEKRFRPAEFGEKQLEELIEELFARSRRDHFIDPESERPFF